MKLDTHHKPIEKRIQIFERRFGKTHLFFAYHAAFPLALTPDLLQCLWANFRFDTRGEVLDIPWVAVNDFLLSGLCEEVGEELYEMDAEIRNLLLDRLQTEESFQQKRIQELSRFLLAYADPLTKSSDRDRRDFGQAQRWTALAYSQPEKAARELALELSQTYQDEKNREDIIRISEIVETLKNPLSEFEQLLNYSRGMVDLVRGNTAIALNYFEKLGKSDNLVEISGVNCLIPNYLDTEEIKKNIKKPLLSLTSLHSVLFLLFALFGGGISLIIWIYLTRFSPTSRLAIAIDEVFSIFPTISLSSLETTSSNTNLSPNQFLTIGSQGLAVEELQTLLQNRGYTIRYGSNGEGKGIFGQQTLNALRQFQRDAGLTVDGVAGSRTFSALRESNITADSRESMNSPSSPFARRGDCRAAARETPLYGANSIRAITGIYLNKNDLVYLAENFTIGSRLIAVNVLLSNISGYVETSDLKLCPPIITQPQTTFPLSVNRCRVIRKINLYESPGFDSQKGEPLFIGENLEVDPQRNETANNLQWIYVSTTFGYSGWVIADSVECR